MTSGPVTDFKLIYVYFQRHHQQVLLQSGCTVAAQVTVCCFILPCEDSIETSCPAQGLDIGPDSLKTFQGALADAKTVIWNGPMGVFEFDAFAKGTYGVAETLAELTPKVAPADRICGGLHVVIFVCNGKTKRGSHGNNVCRAHARGAPACPW